MKAKKALGQHFLVDDHIAHQIAHSLQLTEQYNNVLEVGPGKGILTQYLLSQDINFKAVELDRDMIAFLSKSFSNIEDRLIHTNFLNLDLKEVFNNDPFLLIGNFPYNISTQIIFKMIDNKDLIPEMVGMFQKEVAQRIVAPHGSKTYGVTSVLTQAFYEGSYLIDVPPHSFAPPPKVNSAVIRLTRKEGKLACNYSVLRQVVKTSFNQRRKMMRNTLKHLIKDETLLKDSLFKQRPEQLSVEEFITLAQQIETLNES